jgi:hypothetical protein
VPPFLRERHRRYARRAPRLVVREHQGDARSADEQRPQPRMAVRLRPPEQSRQPDPGHSRPLGKWRRPTRSDAGRALRRKLDDGLGLHRDRSIWRPGSQCRSRRTASAKPSCSRRPSSHGSGRLPTTATASPRTRINTSPKAWRPQRLSDRELRNGLSGRASQFQQRRDQPRA